MSVTSKKYLLPSEDDHREMANGARRDEVGRVP
jgi:hypothetical protein